jgi:hypothetical protein
MAITDWWAKKHQCMWAPVANTTIFPSNGYIMIVHKDYITFSVLGKEINIFSEDLGHSRNTVAEMDGNFHYLGDEVPNVGSAVFAWQDVNGRDLTEDELRQVLIDNRLISQAI